MSDTCVAHRGRDALARAAATQHGIFTRAQALARGVHARTVDRRIADGTWERLYPGVYRIAGAPRSWRGSLLAACLAWGDGAVASHRAAAALWALPGWAEGAIELIVPPACNRARPHRVHRCVLRPTDVTCVDAIPVTTVARTLLDLATVEPAARVEDALDDALRRRLVSVSRLGRWLAEQRRPGFRGGPLLADLLEARAGATAATVPQSVFETRLARLLRDEGLPAPDRQHEVRTDAGRYVVDFAWVAQRVALEADGYRWHAGRRRFEHDRARRNALTASGWTVLHVTWPQLRARPADAVAMIRAALERRVQGFPT